MATNLELDFYSRPILDENEKKLWEVLICDSHRQFEFSKFCQGSEANARWLSATLEEALAHFKAQDESFQDPEKVRFFRRPMSTIITRACESVDLMAQPSRRTFAMYDWLQERHQDFYPQQPGYQPLMPAPAAFEPASPQPLPQTLVGEGWQLVSLQKKDLDELSEWSITFQDEVPPALADLDPETVIPGLLIYSHRAIPLAGWMNGFELGAISYTSTPKPQILLETGINERWIIANVTSGQLKQEAEAFEANKQKANQLHFIAVQRDPNAEEFAGFWVLQELLLV